MITNSRPEVIGVINVGPLPGTPFAEDSSTAKLVEHALRGAEVLWTGGAHGCLLQNADRVYRRIGRSDPAAVSAMAVIADRVVRAAPDWFAVGVQLMRNDVIGSIAVAAIARAEFVRVNTLFGHSITRDGIIDGDPYEVMAYRRSLGADRVRMIADVQTKGNEWTGTARPIGALAQEAINMGADGVSVGHPETSTARDLVIAIARHDPSIPVYLSGHTNHDNVAVLVDGAAGVFVAGCLQSNGWGSLPNIDLVRSYMAALG